MIKKIIKKVVGLALVLLVLTPVLAFSLPVLAADNFNPWNAANIQGTNGSEFADQAGLAGGNIAPYALITSIISWVMGFLGIIAVIVILIGGFKWMTAGGNEDKVGEAKKLLISGLIGLIIVILAYAIASFVITQLVSVTG